MNHYLHVEIVGEIPEELDDELREKKTLLDPGVTVFEVGGRTVTFKYKRAWVSNTE